MHIGQAGTQMGKIGAFIVGLLSCNLFESYFEFT